MTASYEQLTPVSDWGASLETVENVNAGLDLEMPTAKWLNLR